MTDESGTTPSIDERPSARRGYAVQRGTSMGSTYRFSEAPGEGSSVMAWFRTLPPPPVEVPTARGHALRHGAEEHRTLRVASKERALAPARVPE